MNCANCRFDYDPDNPDEVKTEQVGQPDSSFQAASDEIEWEMARKLAKEAAQYTSQMQMEQGCAANFNQESFGWAVETKQNTETAQPRWTSTLNERTGEADQMETPDKNAEKFNQMTGTSDNLEDALETGSCFEQGALKKTDDTLGAFINGEVEQTVPEADISMEKLENMLSDGTEKIDKIGDTLSGYKDTMERISHAIKYLNKKFDSEILNAQNRDSTVKAIYKEMNEYKAGLVEKAMKNVLYDIADLREMMLKQLRNWREKNEESVSLEDFEGYADDLADILERYDVTIYKGSPGQENIAVRQKIIRKVETEDDSLVKKVAESLGYGYEYNEKVLYPEKISIYVKKK